MKNVKKKLSPNQREELLAGLKARFTKNMNRHKGLEWAAIQAKPEANPEKLWSLNEMERTGGEPDVVGRDNKTAEYIFYDCSGRVLKAAGVFVTTARRGNHEKNSSLKLTPWIWQLPWALSF